MAPVALVGLPLDKTLPSNELFVETDFNKKFNVRESQSMIRAAWVQSIMWKENIFQGFSTSIILPAAFER